MPNCRKLLIRCLSLLICLLITISCFSFTGNCVTYETSTSYTSGVYYDRLSDITLTGNPRVDLINVALTQYGYAESNSNRDLSGMKEGINNYTEYGSWYGVQNMWCAMFVSWCADLAGISGKVIPSHSFTPTGLQWFINRGLAYKRSAVEAGEYCPQPGDIVYFRSERNNNIANHVGIVLGYFDGFVYTVEGNVNYDPDCTDGGQVLVRSRHISDPIFCYFCCPNYSSDETHEIGSFFPDTEYRPQPEATNLSLEIPEEETIDTPESASPADRPQFSFIP